MVVYCTPPTVTATENTNNSVTSGSTQPLPYVSLTQSKIDDTSTHDEPDDEESCVTDTSKRSRHDYIAAYLVFYLTTMIFISQLIF